MDEAALTAFAADLAAELGVQQELDLEAVLDLAADAAHGVMRPAAPLTTHLVGLAIGQSGGDQARIADILQRTRTAIETWQSPPTR